MACSIWSLSSSSVCGFVVYIVFFNSCNLVPLLVMVYQIQTSNVVELQQHSPLSNNTSVITYVHRMIISPPCLSKPWRTMNVLLCLLQCLVDHIQQKLYFCLISLLRNNVSKSVCINLRHCMCLVWKKLWYQIYWITSSWITPVTGKVTGAVSNSTDPGSISWLGFFHGFSSTVRGMSENSSLLRLRVQYRHNFTIQIIFIRLRMATVSNLRYSTWLLLN